MIIKQLIIQLKKMKIKEKQSYIYIKLYFEISGKYIMLIN